MKKESGFTLLEIILALVIFSIIVAVAGLGIVTGVKGYVFARQNAHSAQKAQMALARITREFQELYNITAAGADSVIFEGRDGNLTLGRFGNTIRIASGGDLLADGDILIDEIESDGFTLTFYKDNENEIEWIQGTDDIEALTDIKIQINMIRNDISGGSLPFETFAHPRNIGYW